MEREGILNNCYPDTYNDRTCRSAETYMEQRLYELCSVNERKKQIYYEWQANKQKFIKQTQTIIYDFQYYSLHDQSHSRSIIESIEMFLGMDRVNRFGIGDLWLILNCAYSHDIGMAMWHDEVLEMWRNDQEFHRYIETEVNNMASNSPEAYRYYWQLRNIIASVDQMEGIEKNREQIIKFGKDWPVYVRKYVNVITGEYIGRRHAERSKEYLEKFWEDIEDSLGANVAEHRLYQLMGKISYSHSQDLDYILKELEYEANGFGNEKLHPQFAAALLCLGDLLDMDNNRFDPYAIRHFGELPAISEIHLKKHLSITHLRITEFEVEARAESKNMEVCTEAKKWFTMLENALKWITSNWNIIAPREMGGCTFREQRLEVYPNGELFKDNVEKIFRVDKYKLIDLIIGEHLYSSKWVWIREYLQNAMDATKVMLWILARERKEKIFKKDDFNPMKSSPMQMNIDKLEEYAIEFRMEFISPNQRKYDENYIGQIPQEEMIRFQIIDRGIGLEHESLDAITTIGTGWRGRASYQSEMQEILEWLRPTGGFGIGLQAGFMVTDMIEITTKGLRDTNGYRVILKSPRIGGNISTITSREMQSSGTCISLMIPMRDLQTLQKRDGETVSICDEKGYFAYEDMCSNLYDKLQKYIREIIPNNMLPIQIKLITPEGDKSRILYGKFSPAIKKEFEAYEDRYQIVCSSVYSLKAFNLNGQEFLKLWIWDTKDQVAMQLILHKMQDGQQENEGITRSALADMEDTCRHVFCFKNVEVREKIDTKKVWIPNTTMMIDFMGIKAEGCLKVNRDKFNENFNVRRYVRNIMSVCEKYLISGVINQKIHGGIFSETAFRYLLLWCVLTNSGMNYGDENIREELNQYSLVGKKYNCDVYSESEKMIWNEEPINIPYIWIYELFLQKKDLVVFEISNEFEATEEVAYRNIEPEQKESYRWNNDDVARYVIKGGRVLSNAMLYELFKRNSDYQIETVKVNELDRTFSYIVSWNNQNRQKNDNTFEEAIRIAVRNKDVKLIFKRGEQKYPDLVMRTSLSYLSESDLDWENQNVILLPFSKNDYVMLEEYDKEQDTDGKKYFHKENKTKFSLETCRGVCNEAAKQYIQKSRETIEQEYEEVCGLVYDAFKNGNSYL